METTFNSKTVNSDNASVTPNRMNGKMIMQCLDTDVKRMWFSVSPVAKSLLTVMNPFCNMQTYKTITSGQLSCCCCQCSL